MRIVAIPDIHTRIENLHDIAQPIGNADILLLPGDMTNGGTNSVVAMQKVLDILEPMNKHIYTVPGNMDTDEILEMTTQLGINLHRRHIIVDGVAFCGLGGALPFFGKFVFSEAVLADYLNEKPIATVIYDPWLGWELGYYLGPWTNKRRVHYPTPDALVKDALELPETGTRYFVAPKDADIGAWLDALSSTNFDVAMEAQIGSFVVVTLTPPDHP
ncbi:MAG: metallophosphoesterase [Anaerolineae bacterium]|nr:metallophosphoesterase [Anaerolineae bacterium]